MVPSRLAWWGPRVEAQSRNNEMNREMRRKERAERELKQLKADISNKVNTFVHTPGKKPVMLRVLIHNAETIAEFIDP